MIRIRECTSTDTKRLLQLAAHFLATTRYGDLVRHDPERISHLIDIVFANGVIFGASVEEELVGFIAMAALPHPMTGERYAEEVAWFVDPSQQGHAIGQSLLDRAEHWARAYNLRWMKMIAPSGSELGIHYQRLGYRLIESVWMKEL